MLKIGVYYNHEWSGRAEHAFGDGSRQSTPADAMNEPNSGDSGSQLCNFSSRAVKGVVVHEHDLMIDASERNPNSRRDLGYIRKFVERGNDY